MELTVDEALNRAREAINLGQFNTADMLLTSILKAQPDHPDANHDMGLLANTLGNSGQSLPFFRAAIEANPTASQFWKSYIDTLISLDRVVEARRVLEDAKIQGRRGEVFDQLEQRVEAIRQSSRGSRSMDPPEDQLQRLSKLYQQGKHRQALKRTKQLLRVFPDSAALYNVKGVLSASLEPFTTAVTSFQQAVRLDPALVDAHNNLGNVFKKMGDFSAAMASYAAANAIDLGKSQALNRPGDSPTGRDSGNINAQALCDKANKMRDEGHLEAAIEQYRRSIESDPNFSEAYNKMGHALKAQGKLTAASTSYRKAIKIQPGYADAHNNLGALLWATGNLNGAIASYKSALAIDPDNSQTLSNLGVALQNNNNLDEAIDSYRRALVINPANYECHNNMGTLHQLKHAFGDAIVCYKKALQIKPDYADAHHNMGNTLKNLGELDAAIRSFTQALAIDPDYTAARVAKFSLQLMVCDWNAADDDHFVSNMGLNDANLVEPFALLPLEDAPERHLLRAKVCARSKFCNDTGALPAPPQERPIRLRIGYFSADFHNHPVMHLIIGVLERHDNSQFQIYAYSYGPDKQDAMRERVMEAADAFYDIRFTSDEEVAKLVRKDKIDIAIDLTGYTRGGRTGIFAQRLAPIQINYLGYPGTMGADFIDYIIADKIVIPDEFQQYYSEKRIYLPNSYMATDDVRVISGRAMTRSEFDLPENGFVFCVFNSSYKILPNVFDIWMRLLLQVDGSVLWLRECNKWSQDNLYLEAQKRGVDPTRLIFAKRIDLDEHLARHKLADLFLDTFIYNAHSTLADALWAGLPAITKLGDGFAARVAGSLLTAVGMPELVAKTINDYEALALDLARDPYRLQQMKDRLAVNRKTMPLFNTELFTQHLEGGYQQAYHQYFDGKAPDDIFVAS